MNNSRLIKLYLPPKEAVEREIERRACARSLAEFARLAWPVLEPATDLKWGWALDAICEHLEAVTAGEILSLLMNVPPGCMKSLLTAVIWPAWEWGPKNMPQLRYLGTSHKQELAIRDNLKCRRLIQSEWYQKRWPVTLTGDQNQKSKFENDATGFREAMAFTSMTGSRGDRIILDDPLSVEDTNSDAALLAAETTFTEALPTRVNNEKSAKIVIMQRLHERDTSGIILSRELGYTHLCLPMEFEPDRRCHTVIGFIDPRIKAGELLFPERFSRDTVEDLKRTMGEYASAGQFQQRPAPRSGGLFKPEKLVFVDAVPAGRVSWCRGWDFGATVGGDPTAGALLGRLLDGRYIISDMIHGEWSADDRDRALINTTQKDGHSVLVSIPQDPGQAGKTQILDLTRKLAGYPVTSSPETGSKIVRATPFAAQVNVGNVLILRGPWNKTLIDEMSMFPNGTHDDQVDAISRSFSELIGHPTMKVSKAAVDRAAMPLKRKFY